MRGHSAAAAVAGTAVAAAAAIGTVNLSMRYTQPPLCLSTVSTCGGRRRGGGLSTLSSPSPFL